MADVFISYSSEDRERVRPLAAALEQRGLSVWWDRTLAAGDEYASVIENALDAAGVVVVAWSLNSFASPWVRDEVARARKKLAPVLLDQPPISIGFGAIGAVDFIGWDGSATAPQMDVLYGKLRDRLEGRAPDGLLARWRKAKLPLKLISILIFVLAVFCVAGGVFIWNNTHRQAASTAQTSDLGRLLDLAGEGRLSGEQAVQLSARLQQRAFVDLSAPASATPDEPEVVSSSELDESARATFSDAAAQLLQDPNPAVRAATVEASAPNTREAGLDKLWALAETDNRSSGAIYRYSGAIGVLGQNERTREALERARDANPQDRRLWRLLSVQYARDKETKAAEGAALVGEGLSAAASGASDQASATLEKALALLTQAGARAFVLGQLGDAAAKRDDWSAAEKHYRAAVDLHARSKDLAGAAIDAPKLARAQFQIGERARACATLDSARRLGVETVATQVAQMCGAAPSATP
jgi:tetratricopeptide (TPR) repeat protein